MEVATVWVVLLLELAVLLTVAGAAVKWVRHSAVERPGQLVEPAAPLVEQSA
ncbi:hypothetical protein [Parasphingorhabdus pacifica]